MTRRSAIATTSGGADSADRADWNPLRGRECRLWRDNDEAGINEAAEEILAHPAFPCVGGQRVIAETGDAASGE